MALVDPTIKVRGRKYTIDQDQDANGGEVVIDDERILFILGSIIADANLTY